MARGISICKRIVSNPIFVALLLTVLVIIIIVAIYKVQNFGGADLFKCGFYIFIVFLIIIFIHDFLLKKSMKVNHINKDVKEVFTGIDLSKEMSHDVIQVEPISYDTFKNNNNGYGYIQGDSYIKGGNSQNDRNGQNNQNGQNDRNGQNNRNNRNDQNDRNDNSQKNNDDSDDISSISSGSSGGNASNGSGGNGGNTTNGDNGGNTTNGDNVDNSSKEDGGDINNILNSIVPIDIKPTA
uniref:Uncharacterized protein n=1 Tax=viral metagenome TaxID=1070528 RepID=A0A6C0I0W7_9ZZZZ